ncbi:TPA: YkgJ family cysteine cluster protein [Vibrio parahaemolyticus]|nr:YkgJ family cysteine cluster protein [Vibrio parahaemolyticus]
MRKVKPEDEIPVKELTFTAIKNKCATRPRLSKRTTRRFYALDKYFAKAQKEDRALKIEDFMPRMYSIVDDMTKEMTGKDAVCRKGCAWCCKIPLTVSAVEASYIWARYGVEMDMNAKNVIRNEVDDYCPLLDQDTGLCTVYEARPLACRTFFTYDHPKECEDPTNAHNITSMNSHSGFLHYSKTLLAISEGLPVTAYADIREWVKK